MDEVNVERLSRELHSLLTDQQRQKNMNEETLRIRKRLRVDELNQEGGPSIRAAREILSLCPSGRN